MERSKGRRQKRPRIAPTFSYKGRRVRAVRLVASGVITVMDPKASKRLWRAGTVESLTEATWNFELGEMNPLVEKP